MKKGKRWKEREREAFKNPLAAAAAVVDEAGTNIKSLIMSDERECHVKKLPERVDPNVEQV